MGKESLEMGQVVFKCHWHDIECHINQMCDICSRQPLDCDKPNGKAEPVHIDWKQEYDGIYPYCPSCGELPYSLDCCKFCGQRFLSDERVEEWKKPPKYERQDCLCCGGKDTVLGTRARSNGHFHGECVVCGARFIE